MNSFMAWIGGKKLLREKICNEFPNEYSRYVEVFRRGWMGTISSGKTRKN